jgi:hypothetical protein
MPPAQGALLVPSMLPIDPIIRRELPVIRKIIEDETWLEGERRGCPVSPHDSVVQERVCSVVLRIGQDLRDTLTRAESQTQGR